MLERVAAEDWPTIRTEAKAAIERYRVEMRSASALT